MILYRVGPGKWLTIQLFLFGLVSTFQAWQSNYSGYLATRFLLGVTDSGYIPGVLWTLSTWYTRSETAKRIMIFFFGNQLGQASSKLIAYGVLHMKGVGGYPHYGWFHYAQRSDFEPPPPGLNPQTNLFLPSPVSSLLRQRITHSPSQNNSR